MSPGFGGCKSCLLRIPSVQIYSFCLNFAARPLYYFENSGFSLIFFYGQLLPHFHLPLLILFLILTLILILTLFLILTLLLTLILQTGHKSSRQGGTGKTGTNTGI